MSEREMKRSCRQAAYAAFAGIVLAQQVFGQSIAKPEEAVHIREAFEKARGPAQLKCTISPIRPVLDFAFRFQTGYSLEFPLSQFDGPSHKLDTYVDVTGEGPAHVYLTRSEALPRVAPAKADGQSTVLFAVGEGSYGVDVLIVDDHQRFCRNTWQIQARRAGSERQSAPPIPPGKVMELSVAEMTVPTPADKHRMEVGRLTILVHAAPLMGKQSKLQPEDVDNLTDSVTSLLRDLPARNVRLIAFNLDQRAILWRNDGFGPDKLGELADAMRQQQLARVDYRTLQAAGKPIDLLAGLLRDEAQESKLPDAIVILGPQGHNIDDVPPQAAIDRAFPIFYLQYQLRPVLPSHPASGQRAAAINRDPSRVILRDSEMDSAPIPSGTLDRIERLMSRLRGETIPIRTPHDLAEAIHRMDPRIAKTTAAAETPSRGPAPEQTATRNIPTPKIPTPAETASPAHNEVDADPVDVLMRVREEVLAHGEHVPNHTCVETVDRDRYDQAPEHAPKSCDAILARRKLPNFSRLLRLSASDRLRLDVAFSGEREIYSWAGASKFEEGDIDELVPEGAMGTGPFASLLLGVFVGRPPKFTFEGDSVVDGRTLFEYSFHVPKDESHYRYKAHREWLITGYTGTLLVDPKSAELVRLAIRTEELPPETTSCEVDTSMDYGKVRLGGSDFLLPQATRQRFIGREGSEAENRYSFSSCRDFQAESNVVFGPDGRNGGAAHNDAAKGPDWPAGMPVSIELMTSFDSAQAAAGDRIEGRLAAPLRDANRRTLVPQGATVVGRLMRVEVRHASPPQVTIALRWETVAMDGVMTPLHLIPDRQTRSSPQFGGFGGLAGLKRRGTEFELPLPGEEKYAIFHFSGERRVVDGGLRTEWLTDKP
jgi:hypothetical protein